MHKGNNYSKKDSKNEKKKELIKIIDNVLKMLFGKDETETLYFHLKIRKNLDKDEIVDRIDDFIEFLIEIFNDLSQIILNRIINELELKYSVKITNNSELIKFVKELFK